MNLVIEDETEEPGGCGPGCNAAWRKQLSEPWDTVTASANADRAGELAAEARQYEWELRTRCDD